MFVWAEKEYIADVMTEMESKRFVYIENFQAVILNQSKAQTLASGKKKSKKINEFFREKRSVPGEEEDCLQKVQAIDIFDNAKYSYFRKSKKILYMFRKQLPKTQLELRHQRTSDTVFTLCHSSAENALLSDTHLKQFVYKLIETLLPRAAYQPNQPLRLLEIFGDSSPREGWLKIY